MASSQQAGNSLVGEIRFPPSAEADEKTGGRKIRLDLREPQRALWFWYHLVRADVTVASTVRIGTKAVDFLLGPDVYLECEKFACDAETVHIAAPSESEQVVLYARHYLGEATPNISGWSKNKPHVRIGWEPLHYPWNQYSMPEPREQSVTPEIEDAFLKLRRVLMPFRARGHEDVARGIELIENPSFAGSGLARELLDFCLKENLIRRDRGLYVLIRNELNNRGIHWTDLMHVRQVSPEIALFLRDFLKWRGC